MKKIIDQPIEDILLINEKGTINGISVICKPSISGCLGCIFSNKCHGKKENRPQCFANERSDKESIIFKPYNDPNNLL